MQPPKNSPQSLQIQNSKENNHDVGGAYYFNNADFDSTQSNCTYQEWDSTVRIAVSETTGYSDRATNNGETGHYNFITDHTPNVNIFEPCKPLQACIAVDDLEHVPHTSSIKSNLNC